MSCGGGIGSVEACSDNVPVVEWRDSEAMCEEVVVVWGEVDAVVERWHTGPVLQMVSEASPSCSR